MKEVFDLFDFWDGRDGLIDAVKVGDLLRCCGLNPTNALIYKNGGTKRSGNPRTVVHGGCWAKGSFLSLIQWSIPYADVLLVYYLIEIYYVIQFYHAFTESVLTLKCCPNFYLKHIYFHVLYVPRLFVSGFFLKVNLHFSNENVH